MSDEEQTKFNFFGSFIKPRDLYSIPILSKIFCDQKFPKINKYPLTISYCFKCKNVQTNEIINLNLLWQKYTYLTGQTKAIVKHFKQVGKNIEKRKKLKKNDLIIDIGSNDGTFLEFWKN